MKYSLCNQTITIYNVVQVGRDKLYRKTIIKGVFFDMSNVTNLSKTGISKNNSFNCIIPQNADNKTYVSPFQYKNLLRITDQYTLNPQDRIVLGECEKDFEINDTTWASFKTDNMVVVLSVDEKHYRGELVHLEVGG